VFALLKRPEEHKNGAVLRRWAIQRHQYRRENRCVSKSTCLR